MELKDTIKNVAAKLVKLARRTSKGKGNPTQLESTKTSLPFDSEEMAVTITSGGVVTHDTVRFAVPEIATRSTRGLSDIGKAQFQPVGRCIYCGSTDGSLSKEHIIPFGLSGTTTLPAASCRSCAQVTSRFEMDVLRGPMRDVRVYRKLHSRSNHSGAKRQYTLKIERNGSVESVELPLEEFPILFHFITFGPPRVLSEKWGSGIEMAGIATVGFGPHPNTVGKKLGAQKLWLDPNIDHPIPFARMIGKIAYSWAVAQGALDVTHSRPEIVASILGEVDEIGQWVGTKPRPYEKYPDGTLHRIQISKDSTTGMVMVEVQLFADSAAPTYVVVIR